MGGVGFGRPLQSFIQWYNETMANVGVRADSPVFDSRIGRLEKGYHVIDESVADLWESVTDKVVRVTPQEIAMAYGV